MSIDLNPTYSTSSLLASADRGRLDSHSHSVQFYGQDTFLLNELSRYIGSALATGGVGIAIATEAHRDELEEQLKTLGLDTGLAAIQGRYVSLDAAETLSKFMVDGWPDAGRFAEVIGGTIERASAAVDGEHTRLAAFGEMVALLWAEGKPGAAIKLEQLWDDLLRTHSFTLHCAYPMDLFQQVADDEAVTKICAAHSHVIPAEGYASLTDNGERLRAITVLQQKAQALETEIEERKKVQKSLERREAELADFLENAVEGVQQVGPDQVVVWANRALLNLLGYESEEYVGHHFGDFHVDTPAFEEYWQKLMRREDIYDYPAKLRCNDGSVKHVLIHSNGLWEDGRFVHTRCFLRDVTLQKQMEQALRETNHNLREAVATRDEFLSVAAHELRTPVTSLRGFAQLLLRDIRRTGGTAPERLETALNAIELQSGKLARLVARLLDSAQIEAGKLRIEPAKTDLVAMIRGVLEQQDDVKHTFILNSPEQFTAMVDPIRFEQVITNLLDNAVKFSPNGGVVVVGLDKSADGSIRFYVTDEGIGIQANQREAIFDRFHQAENKRHLSGMGLGLYITREIVQLHGGSVRIEQPEHGGSRFVVTLPPSVSAE